MRLRALVSSRRSAAAAAATVALALVGVVGAGAQMD